MIIATQIKVGWWVARTCGKGIKRGGQRDWGGKVWPRNVKILLFFFFYKYSNVALEQIFGLFHLQNVLPKFCSCREFIHDFRRVRKSAKSDYSLHHVCPSVCPLYIRKNSAPTGQIFMKYYI